MHMHEMRTAATLCAGQTAQSSHWVMEGASFGPEKVCHAGFDDTHWKKNNDKLDQRHLSLTLPTEPFSAM